MTLPRVTDILHRAGLIDSRWFTESARDKGTALHMAAQFMEEGALDWSTVDDSIILRLRQYQRFLDEVRPEILAVEEEVTNEVHRYVGHLDRRLRINGREGVLDIKPPGAYPWHPIQLSMYAACFPRPLDRWTLHLHDERYQLIQHTNDRHDWNVAKAAITLAAWREANGTDRDRRDDSDRETRTA